MLDLFQTGLTLFSFFLKWAPSGSTYVHMLCYIKLLSTLVDTGFFGL